MKLKKGDNVLVTAGKDKGKTGKIIRAFPKELKVLIDGINMRKKHIRPKREGEKGQVVQIPTAIDTSDVKMICPKCAKVTRIGYKITEKGKNRICKKCNQEV